MEAITAFCDHLDQCVKDKTDPQPCSALLEAVSMQLALAGSGVAHDKLNGPDETVYPVPKCPDTFSPLEFHRGHRSVSYRHEGTIFTLNLESGGTQTTIDQTRPLPDPSYSPDGRYYTDKHDFVGVFDAQSGQEVTRLSWERNSAEACTVNVVFSQNAHLVAVSYAYDNAVRIWNVHTDDYLGEYRANDHEAALRFSPDGAYLFAGTKNGASLFHVSSGLSIYTNTRKQTYAVGYHPEGTCVIGDMEGPHIYLVELGALLKARTLSATEILETIHDHLAVFPSGSNTWTSWHRLAALSHYF